MPLWDVVYWLVDNFLSLLNWPLRILGYGSVRGAIMTAKEDQDTTPIVTTGETSDCRSSTSASLPVSIPTNEPSAFSNSVPIMPSISKDKEVEKIQCSQPAGTTKDDSSFKKLTSKEINGSCESLGEKRKAQESQADAVEPVSIDSKRYKTRHGPRSWRGLKNIGNTCYINSVLQSLVGLNGLADLPSQYEASLGGNKPVTSAFFRLLNAIHKNGGNSDNDRPYEPRDIKNAIANIDDMFASSTQEDAFEFLTVLIDSLNQELRKKSGDAAPFREQTFTSETEDIIVKQSNESWEAYLKRNNSPLTDMFHCMTMTVKRCRHCKHPDWSSAIFQAQSALNLYVDSPATLQKVLDCYFYWDNDCVQEGMVCKNPDCGRKEQFASRPYIVRCPKYLIVQLKRFKLTGYTTTKVDAKIDYDEFLTLTPRYSMCANGNYRLVSIVKHSGTMNFGHYTACVQRGDVWYECNDSYVHAIDSSKVFNDPNAYILIYECHNNRS